MDTGVTSEYIAALQDEADMFRKTVMEGKCSSFDQYKHKTGYIQGLEKAEQILHETIERLLVAQDLDD